MIAVALGLISAVVMIATGVVVSSSGEDRLTFLGVGVQTTTAQVFVTGAIFAWVFIVALWLLRVGMQKSGARCAELAGRWAGLGRWRAEAAEPGGESVDGGLAHRAGPGLSGLGLATVDLSRFDLGLGGSGPAGDGGAAPWRRHSGPHFADLAVAPAGDQLGALPPDGTRGTSAWTVGGAAAALGIRVGRRGQRREVGGGSRPVPGEDRGADPERGQGAGHQ